MLSQLPDRGPRKEWWPEYQYDDRHGQSGLRKRSCQRFHQSSMNLRDEISWWKTFRACICVSKQSDWILDRDGIGGHLQNGEEGHHISDWSEIRSMALNDRSYLFGIGGDMTYWNEHCNHHWTRRDLQWRHWRCRSSDEAWIAPSPNPDSQVGIWDPPSSWWNHWENSPLGEWVRIMRRSKQKGWLLERVEGREEKKRKKKKGCMTIDITLLSWSVCTYRRVCCI